MEIWGDEVRPDVSINMPDIPEYPDSELLLMEKEAIGFYLTGHPLMDFRCTLNEMGAVTIAEIKELEEEDQIVCGGMITSIKRINTKKGAQMAFITMEDLTGNIEVVFFPRAYQQYQEYLISDAVVLVRGKASKSGENAKIFVDEVQSIIKKNGGELYLRVDEVSPLVIDKIKLLLKTYPGSSKVYLYFEKQKKLTMISQDNWVDLSDSLITEMRGLLGKKNIRIKSI